ncbi:MAG: AbrB/MazE/SpoVT family DNA-binding domain-containing protein [Rhodospirillales bacterium]|nr:AbrB/MazE/SpoVT family DNA-binding domain-containing protein [Rhodospirillales bacterium]
MSTLSITERGQVTLRKDVLRHLGLRPGDKLHVDLLPGGRAELRAERRGGDWDDFAALLAPDAARPRLSIEEIEAVIAEAGHGAGRGVA